MANWKIRVHKKVARQFNKLPSHVQDVIDCSFKDIQTEGPHPIGWDVKKLEGETFRLKLTYRYRMVFEVDEHQRLISITYIGHRKDAYRN